MTKSVEELAKKQIDLLGRRRAAVLAIGAAERQAGEALIDAEDGEDAAAVASIVKARDVLAGIDAAITECRVRRLNAIRSKRQSEAVALRKRASELSRHRDELEAEGLMLMTRLSELQGVAFTATPTYAGQPPRSQLLANEIQALESRAAGLEGELPRSGNVEVDEPGSSTDALIQAVLMSESDSPTVEAVVDWVRAVQGRANDFGDYPRSFHVAWRAGVIDLAESFISVPALARRPPGPFTGAPGWELGSEQFRARSL